MELIGIDVSKHNGHLDWDYLKSCGVSFALIRVGVGDNIESQDDSEARYNIDECKRLEIPWGAYIYSYATAENAIKNGAYVVCSMKPGLWTAKGHYICWWKVDNKYVYICDPASAAAKRSKSNKANLKAQAKQYFIFYK